MFKTYVLIPFGKAAWWGVWLKAYHVFYMLWRKKARDPGLHNEFPLHHLCSPSKKRLKWKTAPCLQAFLNNGLIFLPPIIALDKYQVCRIII